MSSSKNRSAHTTRGLRSFRRLVDLHFKGDIHPKEERELRTELETNPELKNYYEHQLLLNRLDPRALKTKDRLARGLGIKSAPRKERHARLLLASAFATGVAGLLLVPNFPQPTAPTAAFTARGSKQKDSSKIFIYKISPDQKLTAVKDTIHQKDELAFAYDNTSNKRFLMIYAVDSNQNIFWYHPQWKTDKHNPEAIRITEGGQLTELPTAIRHALKGPTLKIHAIFMDHPRTVREMETAQRSGQDLSEAIHHTLDLRVLQ